MVPQNLDAGLVVAAGLDFAAGLKNAPGQARYPCYCHLNESWSALAKLISYKTWVAPYNNYLGWSQAINELILLCRSTWIWKSWLRTTFKSLWSSSWARVWTNSSLWRRWTNAGSPIANRWSWPGETRRSLSTDVIVCDSTKLKDKYSCRNKFLSIKHFTKACSAFQRVNWQTSERFFWVVGHG